jgi:hypothetical protein
MKNLLLGIIAINLTFISINMTLRSIEPAHAASGIQKVAICDYSRPDWCTRVDKVFGLKVN